MSTQIRPELEALSKQELRDANSKFPLFHSMHEGHSIIEEEIDEAVEALDCVKDCFDAFWWHVKTNNKKTARQFAGRLRENALDLASEAIQVAAMAQKFIDSVPGEKES